MLNKNYRFETIEEFATYVAEHIMEYLPPSFKDAEIQFSHVTKHNDKNHISLNIRRASDAICPILYLDSFFNILKETGDIQHVMKEIVKMRLEASLPSETMDFMRNIMDYSWAKERLMIKACDYESNHKRLEDAVYTRQSDFAGVVCVAIGEESDAVCSTQVNSDMLESWSVSRETVVEDALILNRLKETKFRNMKDVLFSFVEDEIDSASDMDDFPMFVLTNSFACNGAAVMFNTEVMDLIGERIGDQYYVIPSSTHELLVIPFSDEYDPAILEMMIHEVNESEVCPEDVLSYHLYQYDMESHTLKRAINE